MQFSSDSEFTNNVNVAVSLKNCRDIRSNIILRNAVMKKMFCNWRISESINVHIDFGRKLMVCIIL